MTSTGWRSDLKDPAANCTAADEHARQLELDFGLQHDVTIQERDQTAMKVEWAVVRMQAFARGSAWRRRR